MANAFVVPPGPDETIYCSRWENQSHREHRDFKKRSEAEQKEYWAWRHNQK